MTKKPNILTIAQSILGDLKTIKAHEVKDLNRDIKNLNKGKS